MVSTISSALEVSPPKFHAPLWPFMFIATVLELVLKPMGIQPPLHRRRMDFFKKSFSFQTKKAKKLIDFAPQYSFDQGVVETALWYRQTGKLGIKTVE
jgi:nucleoside-diphosphate-sugar epimerase